MVKKIKLSDMYFKILLLFPIITLFQGYLEAINKIMFGLLLSIQIVLFLKCVYKKELKLIFVVLLSMGTTVLITGEIAVNPNEYFYFPFVIFYILFQRNRSKSLKKWLLKNKNYVNYILCLWNVLVFISMFMSSSYNSVWGSGRYFGSYCKTIFRFGPTCIFIMTLALCAMIFYENRFYFSYTIVPIVSIFMGGSRTYFLVGTILFLIIWYYFATSSKMFFISLVPLIMILAILMLNSAMADKFTAVTYTSNSYFDFWGTITSGRSIFWKADLEAFCNSSVFNKIFGNGLNLVYKINEKAFGGFVWAHNDFIQCLISHGVLGLGLYLYIILSQLGQLKKNPYGKKLCIPIVCCFFVWFFNAMFNMFYTYFCSVLSLPFLVCAIQTGKRKFDLKRKNQRDFSKE